MKKLLFSCGILLLMSCYSPVPLTLYKDSYRDTQVEDEEDEFVVVTRGNNLTSMDRVSDYAILRAAQIMKKEEYQYFVVSKEIQDFTGGTNAFLMCGPGGCGYAATSVSGVRHPVTGLLIKGYNERPKPEDRRAKVYKTDDILEEFGHYINEIPPKEFDAVNTIYAVTMVICLLPLFWIMTL